jgi:hypothetical protein
MNSNMPFGKSRTKSGAGDGSNGTGNSGGASDKPMPALPPPVQTALIKRLNALVRTYCPSLLGSVQRGTNCFQMNPDVVFSTAQQSETEDRMNRVGFSRGVRDAMLRMVVDVMGDYRRHLVPPLAKPAFSSAMSEPQLVDIFNVAAFRAGAPKANQRFLAKFVLTQSFTKFCDERTFVSGLDGEDEYNDLGAKFMLFDSVVDAAVEAHETLSIIGRVTPQPVSPQLRGNANVHTSTLSVQGGNKAGQLLKQLSGGSGTSNDFLDGRRATGPAGMIPATSRRGTMGASRRTSRLGPSYAQTDRKKREEEKARFHAHMQAALDKQLLAKRHGDGAFSDDSSGDSSSSSSSSSPSSSPRSANNDATTTTANTATTSAQQQKPRASLTGANWTMFNHHARLMLPLKVCQLPERLRKKTLRFRCLCMTTSTCARFGTKSNFHSWYHVCDY